MKRRSQYSPLAERLESRRLLAADFTSFAAGQVASLAWQGRQVEAYADRWIVGLGEAGGDAAAGAVRGLLDRSGHAGWTSVSLGASLYAVTAPGAGIDTVVGWGRATPGIAFVEPDFAINRTLFPNDPSFSQLWGLHNTGQSSGLADADIDAPEAWDKTTGSRSVIIGVIDSGIDVNHPDLAANIWRNPGEIAGNGIDDDANGYVDDVTGWDFASNDNNPEDGNGHGTHVAGTIGAVGNDGRGVAGVNWQVSLLPLKFLDASGSGSTSGAIAAINYATALRNRGVNIVATNNSWGGGGFSSGLQTAIQNHANAGILFVAAAGNDSANNDTTASYPANYPISNIISVAALDRSDRLASFSNYGATKVHIGAPGVSIYSTTPNNQYATYSGTSMATPHVTGVAGLLAAANPQATAAEIRSAILQSAVPIASLAGKTTTGGRLNAAAALDRIAPVAGPRVLSVTPSGFVEPPVTSVRVVFSEGIASTALVGANFDLRGAGADGAFSTADDILVPISNSQVAQSPAGTVTITLGSGLAESAYRLRLVGTGANPLRNAAGQALAGGTDVVRDFTVRVVPPPPPAPLEPNDTLATATSGLGAGATQAAFSGAIGDGQFTTRDVDMFSVQLNAGQTIVATIRAAADGSPLDSYMRLFNASGTQLAFNDDFGNALDSQITFTAAATGTYYVGVSGYGNSTYTPTTGGSGVAGSTGSYQITLQRTTPPLEQNDSMAQATIVSATAGSVNYTAAIGDGAAAAADVDMFRVQLAAGQKLTVDIDATTLSPASGLDSYVRIFNASGQQVAFNDDVGTALDSYLEYTATAAGTFYVGVSGYGNAAYNPATAGSGTSGSTGNYRLNLTFATVAPPPPPPTAATVVGRHLFYNNSRYDGFDARAGVSDDAAIATDKAALLPGATATFANYSSYSRGLNGVMIDVANLAGAPTLSDFVFRVGNTNTTGSWTTAAAPTFLTVRAGAGVSGSSRVTLVWADGAIRQTWLEVTVRATAATGLAAPHVFYFGNAIGEVGDTPANAIVSMTDVNLINANAAATATITNAYDVNRDGRVDTTDRSIAALNRTTDRTALALVSIAAPASAAFTPSSAAIRILGFRDPQQLSERALAFKQFGALVMTAGVTGVGDRPTAGPGRPGAAPKRPL